MSVVVHPAALVSPVSRSAPTTVFYGIAHAGAGVGAWSDVAAAMPTNMELRAIRLPGRETRHAERAHVDSAAAIHEIAATIAADVRAHGVPFLVVGSCSGALLGRSAVTELARAGAHPAGLIVIRQPSALASQAPQPPLSDLPREALRGWLARHGMMRREFIDDEALFNLFEPVIRADLRLGERYRAEPYPLGCPVTVVWRPGDDGGFAAYAAWANDTTAPVHLVTADSAGDLLRDEARRIAATLAAAAARGKASRSAALAGVGWENQLIA